MCIRDRFEAPADAIRRPRCEVKIGYAFNRDRISFASLAQVKAGAPNLSGRGASDCVNEASIRSHIAEGSRAEIACRVAGNSHAGRGAGRYGGNRHRRAKLSPGCSVR